MGVIAHQSTATNQIHGERLMSTGPRHALLLLATGFTLVLGACSTSSGPATTSAANGTPAAQSAEAPTAGAPAASSAAGGATDACSLLTKAEVEAAFGETMLEPVSSVDNGDPTCTYTHSAAGVADLTVAISAQPSSAAGLKSAEAIYGTAATDLPGIGDAAFEFGTLLEFVKGTTLVTIGTGDGPGIISDANFRGLAATAAGRV